MTATTQTKQDQLLEWLDLRRGNLEPGQEITLPVLSGSMLPLLAPGSEIVIRGASWRDCRPGDIIVFGRTGQLTAHRLLWRLRLAGLALFYQKGDTNPFGRWIAARQVVGVVVGRTASSGERLDLTTAGSRCAARYEARRQLARDLLGRALYLPRKVKKWLLNREKNAGSG